MRLIGIGSVTMGCRLAKVIPAAIKIQCLARRYIAWNKVESKRFAQRKCALIILALRYLHVKCSFDLLQRRESVHVTNLKAC